MDPPDTLTQLEEMIKKEPVGSQRDSLIRSKRMIRQAHNDYHRENPVIDKTHLSATERRIDYLENLPIHEHPFTSDDIINQKAVIDAYQSGLLKLEEKKEGEVAIFWNGRLVQGWGVFQDADFGNKCGEWKRKYGGKAWTEDGGTGEPQLQLVQFHALPPAANGHH